MSDSLTLPLLNPGLWSELAILILSAAFPLSGYRVYTYRSESPLHTAYYSLTVSLFLWFFLHALGSILILFDTATAGIHIRRISELFALLSGPLFLYLFMNYPLNPRKRSSRGTIRPRRRFKRLYILEGAALLLALSSLFSYSLDPLVGFSLPTSLLEKVTFHANRLFLIIALLLGVREQRRQLQWRDKSPSRAHIHYLERLFSMGGLGLFVALLPDLLFNLRLWSHSLIFVTILILTVALRKILMVRPIDFETLGRFTSLYLLQTALFLSPLLLLYPLRKDYPALLPGGAALLFLANTLKGDAVRAGLERLLYPHHARRQREVRHFQDTVLRRSLLETADIRNEIVEFIRRIHNPRFLVLYGLEENPGSGASPILVKDAAFTICESKSTRPPALFPEEMYQMIKEWKYGLKEGGLLADFMARAEKKRWENARKAFSRFASLGAEVLLPLYTANQEGGDEGSLFESSLIAVLIFGHSHRGSPLDYSDLKFLSSLRPSFSLALKNEELRRNTLALKNRLEDEKLNLKQIYTERLTHLSADAQADAFVFKPDGVMSEILDQSKRFARRDAPLLITGETGTGKEHIAGIIYNLSERKGRFLTFNCSAVPQDLIENELFGHEKGAFTGAVDSTEGIVERARDGILFIDEIGELSLEGQVKLLRVVQSGEFEKIGSSETVRTNTRFIFATHHNLEEAVRERKFRADLYYRISTFEIHIPPLRERREDIPLLIDHFLWLAGQTFHRSSGLKLSEEARKLLLKYDWPGNVRELENLIMRTVVLSDSDTIDANSLPTLFRVEEDFQRKKIQLEKMAREQTLLEKELLLEALKQSGGNRTRAAEILNISRGSLQYRLKQYGLL